MKSLALMGLIALPFSVAANDDVYLKAEAGLVHFQPTQNGIWWQGNHTHKLNLDTYILGLGIGKAFDKFSLEVTARLTGDGTFTADWEQDGTFARANDSSVDHSITNSGNSEFDIKGIAVEGTYRLNNRFQFRAGALFYTLNWLTRHEQTDQPGVIHECRYKYDGITPVIGVDFKLTKNVNLQLAHYVNVYDLDIGVKSATSLSAGVRF